MLDVGARLTTTGEHQHRLHQHAAPVMHRLGGRNPALPTDMRVDLKLIDEHRFSSGVVHLRYRILQ